MNILMRLKKCFEALNIKRSIRCRKLVDIVKIISKISTYSYL